MTTRSITKSIGGIMMAGLLALPVWAQGPQYNPQTNNPQYNYPQNNPQYGNPQYNNAPGRMQNAPLQGPPAPGTVNYIEGQATLAGQPLNQNSAGTELQPGQVLATQNGRAEILLSPGVFFRLGENSAAQVVSPAPENIEMRLTQGRAMVEVDWLEKESHVQIDVGAVPVVVQEKGLYDLDASKGLVRVFDGRLAVMQDGKEHHVLGGHQMVITTAKLKATGFDKKANEDALYRWSRLRSSYLAEANAQMAREYYGEGPYAYGYAPYPWYGYGWYWDPWFAAYTWLPGDGLFWNPWGFGFYSPFFAFEAPFIGFGFHAFGPGFHPVIVAHEAFAGRVVSGPAFRGSAAFRSGYAGAYHGGFARGGGFHGGGGGRR